MNGHLAALSACLVAALFLLPAPGGAVSVGDSRQDLLTELGPPPSYMKMGERDILIYDRGKVELVGDEVTEVELITPTQWEARQRREAEAEARREAAAEQRMRELTEAVKARTLALRSQDVPVEPAAAYESALQELRAEEDRARREAEREALLARLEARVLTAQADALQAEAEAALARKRAAEAEATAQRVREQQADSEAPNAPCTAVHHHGDVCYPCGYGVDAYAVYYPVAPAVRRPAPAHDTAAEPRSVKEIGGRYSTERRLGEEGPLFGGAPPRWGR